jgi:hypothetical protein
MVKQEDISRVGFGLNEIGRYHEQNVIQ